MSILPPFFVLYGLIKIAVSAVGHIFIFRCLVKNAGPLADALQDGDDGPAFFGQRIFNSGRNLIVGLPFYNAIADQAFERRSQHGVCDISHFFADGAVAQRPHVRQNADDAGIPFAAENLKPVLQRAADVFLKFFLIHKFVLS
jgi:hypothetical protein